VVVVLVKRIRGRAIGSSPYHPSTESQIWLRYGLGGVGERADDDDSFSFVGGLCWSLYIPLSIPGGEWGAAVLYCYEHAPRAHRGLYACIPQMGLALGLAMSTGTLLLIRHLPTGSFQSYGWR